MIIDSYEYHYNKALHDYENNNLTYESLYSLYHMFLRQIELIHTSKCCAFKYLNLFAKDQALPHPNQVSYLEIKNQSQLDVRAL